MLFNSYGFIFVFLPITFFLYFYFTQKREIKTSKIFLVLASLFFYSWWNILYLPILVGSILFNYLLGISLSRTDVYRPHAHKVLLTFGIISNIFLLGYFKYTDFLIENINAITQSDIPLLHLTLPLAISFFTFQQIAYIVDSYQGKTREYSFLNYTMFVTFFPQLIAGPIVHHSEMMPQFTNIKNRSINYRHIAMGLYIFSIGLFKKVILADTFAVWATAGFDKIETLNLLEAWATSLSYTFQIYFDFSGYTDMAIGAALLFNIKLPINFNSPYKATSIKDFWRRWHITLSRFLRDYIYIPLGGNRQGRFRTYTNILTTFVIGGIWHGAGWTFVFWGLLHGLAMIIQRIWKYLGFKMHTAVAWFITFNFVNIAWVFFRAKEWDDAMKVIHAMFSLDNVVIPKMFANLLDALGKYGVEFANPMTDIGIRKDIFIWLLAAFILIMFFKNSIEKLQNFRCNYRTAIFTSLLFVSAVFSLHHVSEFLYFNF